MYGAKFTTVMANAFPQYLLSSFGLNLLYCGPELQGEFMLTTSVSASQALAAVGMEDTGLNVLSDDERRQLLDRVRDRIR